MPVKQVKAPSPLTTDYSNFASISLSSVASTTTTITTSTASGVNLTSATARAGEKITDVAKQNVPLGSFTANLLKVGTPTGSLRGKIRKTSDDSVVAQSTNTVALATGQFTFNFDWALTPAEAFRLSVEYEPGTTADASNYVNVQGGLVDDYTNGVSSQFFGSWTDNTTRDLLLNFVTSTTPPTYATDGNTTTKAQTNNEANPWVKGDMSTSKLVSGCRIFWGATGKPTQSFTIQASTDDVTYTTVATIGGNPPASQYSEYVFNTSFARYLKVVMAETMSLEVYEFQVYSSTTEQLLSQHGHGV